MGGEGKENPGLKPCKIVREFVGLKPHANPKGKSNDKDKAKTTTERTPKV
jgi:hypothetical protein